MVGSFGGEVLGDGSVSWKVALDGEEQSGGGGTYHQFQARVCVEFVVGRTSEPHVTMTDTECDRTFVEGRGRISAPDAVVTLDEGGGDPGPAPTTRRVCQERSGGDSDCPGG